MLYSVISIFGIDVVSIWPHIIMIKRPILIFRNYCKFEAKAKILRKNHPKKLKFSQMIGGVKTQTVPKYFFDTIISLSNIANFSQ